MNTLISITRCGGRVALECINPSNYRVVRYASVNGVYCVACDEVASDFLTALGMFVERVVQSGFRLDGDCVDLQCDLESYGLTCNDVRVFIDRVSGS